MRLTRKIEPQVWETFTFPKYDYNRDNYGALLSSTESVINKLGELEDIENELGIDLATLFKALKDGIWFEDCNEIIFTDDNRVCITNDALFIPAYEMWLDFKDYGKTWALTKEEL